jgi:CHAT domain-containing protein/tetratricopeptide (TPR) repeat protein
MTSGDALAAVSSSGGRLATPRPWRALLVATLMAGLAAVAVLRWRAATADPTRALIDAAPRTARELEPRLSGGFPWAPLRAQHDPSSVDRDHRALVTAAAQILRGGSDDTSPIARHARALAQLLSGRADDALAVLDPLASTSRSSAVWTDLAAAHYVAAIHDDDPSRLTHALVAADAALQIDPASNEARFNRALIIEALGLRDLAREEWQTYLRRDPTSPWALEARNHVRALAPEEDFLVVLAREYDRLGADPTAAHAFARRYRQRCRTWGEAEILGDWARAVRQGDATAAAKHLRVARELGKELSLHDGNQMLSALVETIDHADPERYARLATAQLHFSDGLRAFRNRRSGEAQVLLLKAASEFSAAASPGELRARYYAINTMFVQGRIHESGQAMQRLLDETPPQFPGNRADILWVIAAVASSEGRWGTCIDGWTDTVRIFERLGETNNAAIVRGQLVATYDRLGNPTRAWKSRMLTLHELGRQISTRQQEATGSVTRAALVDEDYPAALSFLGLELAVAGKIDQPLMHVEALLYRAEILQRMGQRERAVAGLAEARRMFAQVPDEGYRSQLEASAKSVQASLASDPRTAIALLTEVIAFHSSKGRRMYLPELLRKRGRAFEALDHAGLAAADFEEGVLELERHRDTLPGGEDRWGIFHGADELFGDAIALAVSRNDVRTAFDYAERARARTLMDALGLSWRHVSLADIPPGTAVIEYAMLRDSIVIFVAGNGRLTVRVRRMDRRQVMAKVNSFVAAGAASDRVRLHAEGRWLDQLLIEPIRSELTGARTLAIVPDPVLGGMPFAALVDGDGHYLLERCAIAIEPSASFFTRARKLRRTGSGPNVLVVEGSEELGLLPAVQREAEAVSRVYPHTTLLTRPTATPASFARQAIEADIVHFAGHAVAYRSGSRDGYLLLASSRESDGRLDLKQIASMRLPRTSLVVLAACGTADGEIRSTEGTISVGRAFLAAGVPSVVTTLWPVDDQASAAFFPLLHQHLARGLTPAVALRATQLEWIHSQHPPDFTWAAIQALGE